MDNETNTVAAEVQPTATPKTATTAPASVAPKTTAAKKATATPKKATAASKKTTTKATTTANRKPAAKKTASKKPAAAKKPAQDISKRAQEVGRDALLASLGFYGKAYDQAQEQYSNLQDQLEARREKANTLYKELIKRGKKIEADAKVAIEDLDLNSLTDRQKLEARLEKAKVRFQELKDSVGLKSAA